MGGSFRSRRRRRVRGGGGGVTLGFGDPFGDPVWSSHFRSDGPKRGAFWGSGTLGFRIMVCLVPCFLSTSCTCCRLSRRVLEGPPSLPTSWCSSVPLPAPKGWIVAVRWCGPRRLGPPFGNSLSSCLCCIAPQDVSSETSFGTGFGARASVALVRKAWRCFGPHPPDPADRRGPRRVVSRIFLE